MFLLPHLGIAVHFQSRKTTQRQAQSLAGNVLDIVGGMEDQGNEHGTHAVPIAQRCCGHWIAVCPYVLRVFLPRASKGNIQMVPDHTRSH